MLENITCRGRELFFPQPSVIVIKVPLVLLNLIEDKHKIKDCLELKRECLMKYVVFYSDRDCNDPDYLQVSLDS